MSRRTREKHRTACRTVCDVTKATTDIKRVTCKLCARNKGDELMLIIMTISLCIGLIGARIICNITERGF